MAAGRIMIQGTGSHVGKSVLVTALCRLFKQDGYRVAPFKAQNMSLNSFVTREGGEMARSQVVQAEAAGVEPHVDMNPVLLKPTGERGSQVIVGGKAIGTLSWREYSALKGRLWDEVTAAFHRLAARYEIVVIEGAGSPAEVNLREGDIVNMRVARMAQAPVYLVADLDRGGALAWVVGTVELLPPKERALVKGIVLNKFRGDREILRPGLTFLQDRLGLPVAGVIPYLRDLAIAEEDSVALDTEGAGCWSRGPGPRTASPSPGEFPEADTLDVAVIQPARISNFTDVEPLKRSPDVSLRFVRPGQRLGRPDLVILPGSKNTLDDLFELAESGLAGSIRLYARQGGCVVGICGGYQMLGTRVADPSGTESTRGESDGIGLLPVTTTLLREKVTAQVRGVAAFPGDGSVPVAGYEIHTGRTVRHGGRAWIRLQRKSPTGSGGVELDDGCYLLDPGGRGTAIFGTYVHGLFDGEDFRRRFLDFLRERRGWSPLGREEGAGVDPYDRLAETLRAHLDVDRLYRTLWGQ